MALTEEQVREMLERDRERWRRAEENATTPELAARYRGLRRRVERVLASQARRQKAEAGLLPCPACGEWGDLRSGACVRCGEGVDWQAVTWQTGTWQVHLACLLLFGAVTGALLWFIAAPNNWPVLRVAALLPLVPAGWLTYLNALRVARLVAWGLPQRGG